LNDGFSYNLFKNARALACHGGKHRPRWCVYVCRIGITEKDEELCSQSEILIEHTT
jgi:hypothetical protein